MTGDVRSKAFWCRSEQAQDRVEAVTCRFTDRCASRLSLLDSALRWWESVVMSGATPCLAAVEEGVVPVLHLLRQARWCHVGRGGIEFVWWGVHRHSWVITQCSLDVAE